MLKLEVSCDMSHYFGIMWRQLLGLTPFSHSIINFFAKLGIEVMVVDIDIIFILGYKSVTVPCGIQTGFIRYDGHQIFAFFSCSSMIK